jgi:hypothetical protein
MHPSLVERERNINLITGPRNLEPSYSSSGYICTPIPFYRHPNKKTLINAALGFLSSNGLLQRRHIGKIKV